VERTTTGAKPVNASPRPRRTSSATAQKPRITTIVVGLDGSASSDAALRLGIEIARGLGSKVIAVHAVDVPSDYPELNRQRMTFDDAWRKTMKSVFENEWCRPLVESGVQYRAIIKEGRAAKVILSVAAREQGSVIVTGRRGRGKVAELVLGSVSNELVHSATVPVVVTEPAGNRGRRRWGSGWTRY
jgi:nucleotide-binding universal stress UspA family protein